VILTLAQEQLGFDGPHPCHQAIHQYQMAALVLLGAFDIGAIPAKSLAVRRVAELSVEFGLPRLQTDQLVDQLRRVRRRCVIQQKPGFMVKLIRATH
jgi:hypothetical protein